MNTSASESAELRERKAERDARRRFVTKHGIVRTGLPLGVILTLVVATSNNVPLNLHTILSWRFLLQVVLNSLVMGCFGKYVYGPVMWKFFARDAYRQERR